MAGFQVLLTSLRKAEQTLEGQLEGIRSAISSLQAGGGSASGKRRGRPPGKRKAGAPKKKRKMSAKARKAISDAQKKRWAEQKKKAAK